MGDAMLSTPQKVLRDTLRGKINSSTKDVTSPPQPPSNDGSSTEEDYGDEEREMEIRREALRQRGRESYAKRKESSIASTNTTPASIRSSRRMGGESFIDRLNGVGDDDDDDEDDDDDDEDVFFNESRSESKPNSEKKPPPRKKRKSGGGDQAYHPSDEGIETDEDEPYLKPEPGSGKRKASSSQRPGGSSPGLPVAKTPPSRARRVDSTSTTNTVVSRFKEGSMRDRASAVPPQEIIGMLPSSSSPARPDDDQGTTRMSTTVTGTSYISGLGGSNTEKSGAANSGASFTFGGLTSLIPFNPFRIVKDIKESWDRQKRLHEAKERKKKLLRERKLKGLLAYEEFKRMGTLQGYTGNAAAIMGAQSRARNSSASLGPIRVDYVQDYNMADQYDQQIGRAVSTDESRPASRASTASTKLRRRMSTMTSPLAGEGSMKGMADSFYEGRGAYVDEDGNLQRYSVDSAFMSPPGSFSRRSMSKTPKSGKMAPPSWIPQPHQIPSSKSNGGKFEDVKTLVKKKSKTFAATIIGRSEDADSRAISKESKREARRQERLMKKVSNLEDQLDKARRELESAIDTPPAPLVSSRKRILPINTNAPRGRESVMSARESVTLGDETDEGEKTEVDEPTVPLSPVMSASFGGSFMAKTAEMTIMESLDELENGTAAQGKGNTKEKPPTSLYEGIVLPKRASKSNLGAGRRRRVASNSKILESSTTAKELKHQGSLPAISSRGRKASQPGAVPPVPKSTGGK